MLNKNPWAQRYDAASKGLLEINNPYDKTLYWNEHMGWRSGWYDYTYQSQEDNYCGGY